MAPAPSPNAVGLAAYRQLAGNLRVDDIPHGYWTSRKGNSSRFSLWAAQRRHAAPYLREIAKHHGQKAQTYLEIAAREFAVESEYLDQLTALLPVGVDEQSHWEEANMAKAEDLLGKASVHHMSGMAALEKVAKVDRSWLLTRSADNLQQAIAGDDLWRAEEALAALVNLSPPDLDQRLAALFLSEPDVRKRHADGPIHRQILWALAKLDSDVATDAIRDAIFFPGKSDAVPRAVSNWAGELYWERRGKLGVETYLRATKSEIPHVVDTGLKYIGRCGDKSVLPKLMGFEKPAAYEARILLGDDRAWPLLIQGLGTPEWFDSYSRLRAMGAKAEEWVIPFATSKNPQLARNSTLLLSRIGTEKSLPVIRAAIARNPDDARLKQALSDLEALIAGRDR
jgi:hypothetical protein